MIDWVSLQALNITTFGIIAVSLDVGIVEVLLLIRALRKIFGQEGHHPTPALKSESANAPMIAAVIYVGEELSAPRGI